jgi:hypothetical protein
MVRQPSTGSVHRLRQRTPIPPEIRKAIVEWGGRLNTAQVDNDLAMLATAARNLLRLVVEAERIASNDEGPTAA